jgi:hypothetical protein
MDKPLFNLLNTNAPAATLVVRLLPGLVFLAEGIKKLMFPTEWGIGRFEKIGIIYPHLSAFICVVCWRRGDRLWASADLRALYPASSPAIANRYFGGDPDYESTACFAQRILAGGSRGSGGLFDVHELVVSPHCRRRGHVVGRLVGEKASRFVEAESNRGIACLCNMPSG